MPDTPAARFSFRSGFVLDMVPGLHDFLFLPLAERLAILRDPDRREELRSRAEEPSPYGHLVDWGSGNSSKRSALRPNDTRAAWSAISPPRKARIPSKY